MPPKRQAEALSLPAFLEPGAKKESPKLSHEEALRFQLKLQGKTTEETERVVKAEMQRRHEQSPEQRILTEQTNLLVKNPTLLTRFNLETIMQAREVIKIIEGAPRRLAKQEMAPEDNAYHNAVIDMIQTIKRETGFDFLGKKGETDSAFYERASKNFAPDMDFETGNFINQVELLTKEEIKPEKFGNIGESFGALATTVEQLLEVDTKALAGADKQKIIRLVKELQQANKIYEVLTSRQEQHRLHLIEDIEKKDAQTQLAYGHRRKPKELTVEAWNDPNRKLDGLGN